MDKNWNKLLRPLTWNELVGQSHLVSTFNTMIMGDNFPSFSIFAGPTGVGKSCAAELVAKTILCTGEGSQPCNRCPNCNKFNTGVSSNIIKYDMPNIKESEVENIIDSIFNHDFYGKKVFIIEEAQAMDDRRVQQKWLEPLMHIPDNVTIIFCTTHYNQIIPQIRNRAQSFFFETPSTAECMELVRNVAAKVNFELPAPDVVEYFVTSNRNSPRGIIQTLEIFAHTDIKSDEELRKFFRINGRGAYHKVLCSLINNEQNLYSFVRVVNECGIKPNELISGLRDYVMSVILELSLGTSQGLNSEDRKEIQEILKTQGDKLFLKVMEEIGGYSEFNYISADSAMSMLTVLKIKLLGLNSQKVVKENLGNTAAARVDSMNATLERGRVHGNVGAVSDSGRPMGSNRIDSKQDLDKTLRQLGLTKRNS